jgi:hypothetical protein
MRFVIRLPMLGDSEEQDQLLSVSQLDFSLHLSVLLILGQGRFVRKVSSDPGMS